MTAGSEFVARWREEAVGDDGPASASASGRYVEMESVRFDGRWKRRGTWGRVADGAGLGRGRLSREVRRKVGENVRLSGSLLLAEKAVYSAGDTYGIGGADITGEVGTERPWVVVTVSLRRRLIDLRISAPRSSERNDCPCSR